MNTGASSPSPANLAEAKASGIQTKLHRWATAHAGRRFDDLFNLVTDPAFLAVAWERVRTNRGARTAGVDGSTAYYVRSVRGEDGFLADLRAKPKAGGFVPLPGAERTRLQFSSHEEFAVPPESPRLPAADERLCACCRPCLIAGIESRIGSTSIQSLRLRLRLRGCRRCV